MADVHIPPPETTGQWFRGHVLTRFFATVWWVVMVGVSIAVGVTWITLVWHHTPGAVASAAIAGIIFIPVWREWPNWRRMARLLRHGT